MDMNEGTLEGNAAILSYLVNELELDPELIAKD